jgi:hypothetical protein
MHTGLGRQVRSNRFNGLDARFLIVRDDRHLWLLLRCRRRLFQDFHLAIGIQHFGHLFLKVGIALFQVVSHFVRFHLFLVEDLAHRALRQVGKARMPFLRTMLAGVAGQKPRRPQFVGIAKFLCLPARQRHQPCLGFECDRRLPTGARAIVQRYHRAFNHGTLDATLNSLMMQSERSTNRKKRRVFPVGQQYPCSFHPARRLRSQLRYRFQPSRILISERQFNRPPPRCHDLTPSLGTRDLYRNPRNRDESPRYDNFHGIDRLVITAPKAMTAIGSALELCSGARAAYVNAFTFGAAF